MTPNIPPAAPTVLKPLMMCPRPSKVPLKPLSLPFVQPPTATSFNVSQLIKDVNSLLYSISLPSTKYPPQRFAALSAALESAPIPSRSSAVLIIFVTTHTLKLIVVSFATTPSFSSSKVMTTDCSPSARPKVALESVTAAGVPLKTKDSVPNLTLLMLPSRESAY